MEDSYDLLIAKHLESLISERQKLVRDHEARLRKIDQLISAYQDSKPAPADAVRGSPSVEGDRIPMPKPNEFRGQKPGRALESYLSARRECRKIPFRTAVEHLVAGGVESGKSRGTEADRTRLVAHTLKITLFNRRRTFAYEPYVESLKGVPEEKIWLWLNS